MKTPQDADDLFFDIGRDPFTGEDLPDSEDVNSVGEWESKHPDCKLPTPPSTDADEMDWPAWARAVREVIFEHIISKGTSSHDRKGCE